MEQEAILLTSDERDYVYSNLGFPDKKEDKELKERIIHNIIQMAWKLSENPDQLEWLYFKMKWDKENEDDLWYHTFFEDEVDYIIANLDLDNDRLGVINRREDRVRVHQKFIALKPKLEKTAIARKEWEKNRQNN